MIKKTHQNVALLMCEIPWGHVTFYASMGLSFSPAQLDDVPFYCNVPEGHIAINDKINTVATN